MSSNFVPWAKPDPQSVFGLNSAMVYGENIQFAVGLNHQVAVGSNLQLCINPVAMLDDLNVPACAALTGFLGSGLGGNVQLCVGTNTNITWGRQFAIAMGPETITIDGTKHRPLTITMLCLISGACIAYAIVFGLTSDEDHRASIVIGFQVLVDCLLAALVVGAMFLQDADKAFTGAIRTLFDKPDAAHSSQWWALPVAVIYFGLWGALLVPPIAIALEEGHFGSE